MVGYKCSKCAVKGERLTVHHLTYERLGCELLSDLTPLCRGCHNEAHRYKIPFKEIICQPEPPEIVKKLLLEPRRGPTITKKELQANYEEQRRLCAELSNYYSRHPFAKLL